jgi:hypothetical protein
VEGFLGKGYPFAVVPLVEEFILYGKLDMQVDVSSPRAGAPP